MGSKGCCAVAGESAGVDELKAAVHMGQNDSNVRDTVKEYYGKVLETSEDLKTSACCTAKSPSPQIRQILKKVPNEVVAKYYGCGSPFPVAIDGLRVLDLGSGSGRDCYVCAALVGESGSVLGVDMTEEQLEVARKYSEEYCTKTLGYESSNLNFVCGQIEDLKGAGIGDETIDLIISNCVVNLSPDKEAVLREAYRVLAPGGEMYFSDVYCDRRLPVEARKHPVLVGECLGGALYEEDFLRLARAAGFTDPRRFAAPEAIEVKDEELTVILGEAKFTSVTYRLFKLPGRLETLCEDYGQAARYKGTMKGASHACILDDHHVFETGKWYEVCGNTASMVGESWMGKHFDIIGDRSKHYGVFGGCGEKDVAIATNNGNGGSCC